MSTVAPDTSGPHSSNERASFGWLALFGGAILILGLTLLAYRPALAAGFVWDDDEHFTHNPFMSAPGGLWKLWTQHSFYYPLTSTSFWLITRVFGTSPLPFHLVTILLHAVNSILLWRVARRLGFSGAFACGLVFALHPVHVQSVAWATELKNTQSGFFYLLSIFCFIAWMERHRNLTYGWSLAFFVLALLSKTSTVTLPFILTLIWLWRGGRLDGAAIKRLAPFFAIALVTGLLTVLLHREHVGSGAHWGETVPERALLAMRGVWFYLGKLAWPSLLVFVYARWDVGMFNALWGLPLIGCALLPMLPALIRNPAARRVIFFSLAAFVASLLPVLNFFRMYYSRYSYAADHWQYLADMTLIPVGVALAATIGSRFGGKIGSRSPRFLGAVCAVMFALLLGVLTFRQCGDYRDFKTLWVRTIEKNPQAGVAYSNLGTVYLEIGELEAAAEILARGAEASPKNAAIKSNLALLALKQNRFEDAVRFALDAIAADPDELTSYSTLAAAHYSLGQVEDSLQALRDGLARNPKDERLLENLGKLQGRLAPAN